MCKAGRRQTGEGKLELEKKQEGDKQAYGEPIYLWKIHAKNMEEMGKDPCYHPSSEVETLSLPHGGSQGLASLPPGLSTRDMTF